MQTASNKSIRINLTDKDQALFTEELLALTRKFESRGYFEDLEEVPISMLAFNLGEFDHLLKVERGHSEIFTISLKPARSLNATMASYFLKQTSVSPYEDTGLCGPGGENITYEEFFAILAQEDQYQKNRDLMGGVYAGTETEFAEKLVTI